MINRMTINGGADLYATDAEYLRREGAISLKVFSIPVRNMELKHSKRIAP